MTETFVDVTSKLASSPLHVNSALTQPLPSMPMALKLLMLIVKIWQNYGYEYSLVMINYRGILT